MPPGGEDLITYGEWIRPVVLPVPRGSRRCLKFSLLSSLDILDISPPLILILLDHLLSFLKILFTTRAWEPTEGALLENDASRPRVRATLSRVCN